MAIDLAAYWLVATTTAKIFTNSDGVMVRAETQSAAGLISDDDDTGMIDQWQLKVTPAGIFEVRDNYPGGTIPYVTGYEYPWGTRSMKVGDKISRSTGLQKSNNRFRWGYAVTTLVQTLSTWTVPAGTYNDVAVIDSMQYWCNADGPICGGLQLWHSVFYLAKGIGPIEQDWVQTPTGSGVMKMQSFVQGNS